MKVSAFRKRIFKRLTYARCKVSPNPSGVFVRILTTREKNKYAPAFAEGKIYDKKCVAIRICVGAEWIKENLTDEEMVAFILHRINLPDNRLILEFR